MANKYLFEGKIASAREKFQEFERAASQFFAGDVFLLEEALRDGKRVMQVRLGAELPDKLYTTIGLLFYELRSALDQVVSAAAEANGSDPKKAAFPFAGDLASFEKEKKRIAGLSPPAQSIIEGLKPYKGGDDRLWGFGKLANIDKHDFCVPIGSVGNVNYARIRVDNAHIAFIMNKGNLAEGLVVSELGPRGTFRLVDDGSDVPPFSVRADLQFGDVPVFANSQTNLTTLELINKVTGIVAALKPFT